MRTFDPSHPALFLARLLIRPGTSPAAAASAAASAWGAGCGGGAFRAGVDVGGDDHADRFLPTRDRAVLGAIVIVIIVQHRQIVVEDVIF
jgi:hypothetical protein